MKKLTLIYSLVILFGFLSLSLKGQTFEQYKKQEKEKFDQFKKEQDEWIKNRKREFKEYVDKKDKEFKQFLEQNWRNYKPEAPIVKVPTPKPEVVPEYTPPSKPTTPPSELIPISPVKPKPIIVDNIPQIEPVARPLPDKPVGGAISNISYFGTTISFEYDPAFKIAAPTASNKQAVADFWSRCSSTDYAWPLDQLQEQKEKLSLNDYEYYLLVKAFSDDLYGKDSQGSILMSWFLMLRSGYGIRLANSNNTLYHLLPAYQDVYGISFIEENGRKLYIMTTDNISQINAYPGDYEGASKPIDFTIIQPAKLGRNLSYRNISFPFQGKTHSVRVAYNPALIKLYDAFPQLEISTYFNSVPSLTAKESLIDALKPLLADKSQKDQVELLLSFVQNGFEYQTDPEQFGREKFFFAEEVLYYPYCDCEDRSVLFSYLVRNLVGLEVCGLEYPGHMATAVNFETSVNGDYIEYGNKRYIISDPTYIGAPIGLCMPQFKEVSPKIVLIDKPNLMPSVDPLWQQLAASGCYPARVNGAETVTLGDGAKYLIGFNNKDATFLGKSLEVSENGNSYFIGKTNSQNQPEWVKTSLSTKGVLPVQVALDASGNLYIAGSFTGTLKADPYEIVARNDKRSLFLCGLTSTGNIKWLKTVSLDSLNQGTGIDFSLQFDLNGRLIGTPRFVEAIVAENAGLFFDSNNKVFTLNGQTGLFYPEQPKQSSVSFASGAKALTPEVIKEENDALISGNTERGIAGVFAVANLVCKMGYTFTGIDAQRALDKYNPNFKQRCSETYKNLGKITFLKNAEGVISIQTDKGQDISFDKVRIKNGSKLTISQDRNGDIQFNILSGIKVGKAIVWYDLNFVKMRKTTGDLIFDYDSDHSQKQLNLKKDILN
ncbi:MAG: hypothetical protein LWX70_02175 [Sphingobacteriia bacterium]|nr:hypothetical protein [Sphingobacteriia bacterium]